MRSHLCRLLDEPGIWQYDEPGVRRDRRAESRLVGRMFGRLGRRGERSGRCVLRFDDALRCAGAVFPRLQRLGR